LAATPHAREEVVMAKKSKKGKKSGKKGKK
jgi:hypothetical protein